MDFTEDVAATEGWSLEHGMTEDLHGERPRRDRMQVQTEGPTRESLIWKDSGDDLVVTRCPLIHGSLLLSARVQNELPLGLLLEVAWY